jgi:hypothetical protein
LYTNLNRLRHTPANNAYSSQNQILPVAAAAQLRSDGALAASRCPLSRNGWPSAALAGWLAIGGPIAADVA